MAETSARRLGVDPVEELTTRIQVTGARGWGPRFEDYSLVAKTCLHCCLLRRDHANGECLFSSTRFERFGLQKSKELYYEVWHKSLFPNLDQR